MSAVGIVLLLARRTARRQRLQIVTTALLVALAAMMINLGVIAATDYPAAQRATADRLATSDLQLHGTDAAAVGAAAAHLREQPQVRQVATRTAREAWASFAYNASTTATTVEFFVPDQHADIALSHIVEEASERYAEPIWLPYVFKGGGRYALGDAFTITIGQASHTFRVQGFYENLYLGMMTMGFTGLGVQQDQLDAIGAGRTFGGRPLPAATFLEVRVADGADAAALGAAAVDNVKAEYTAQGLEMPMLWADAYALVETAALVGPNLYAVSLVAFAALIALVVVVVIRFVIRTAVLQDMTAIGTLAAAGVTATQALWGIALPMAGTALAGAVVGVVASYGVLPGLAASLMAQTGIRWEPGVSLLGAAAAVSLLTLTALVTAMVAARGVRRVTPVQAVRGGAGAHSFRRTVFPLASSRGGLNALLGVKASLQHASQNVMVAVVIALVTFAGMFSAALYTDVIGSREAFTRLMIGDLAPVQIQVKDAELRTGQDAGRRADLLREVVATPGVRKAFYADNRTVGSAGTQIMLAVTEDFSRMDDSSLYAGREPRHDNEVAIGGRVADHLGTSIGDTITLEAGANSRAYVVVGLLSTVNYVGMKADITSDGFRRMVPAYQPDVLSVYLQPGTTIADIKRDLSPAAYANIGALTDTREVFGSQMDVYIEMGGFLAAGILIGTGGVIALVMGLVTATMLVRTRRSLGVRKALGFTSGQLVAQTVMTYLPVVVAGALLGAGLGLVLVEPALLGMLRTVGIMALGLTVKPYIVAALLLGIVGLATLLIVAQSGTIRRITPYSLFQDA